METLFSDQFNDITYNKENGIHYHILKPTTAQMTEAEFKQMLLNWKQLMFSCNPQWILVDSLNFHFPISPTLQTWVVQNITMPVLAIGSVIKYFFVLPEEFISQLSISQFTDEANNVSQEGKIKYFSSKEAAEIWLKSND
ncbi:hypothetical protein [Microscilla marina]|uniref:STAS/SEC14 domain-containing protein n=1 Tax=Microscilla marina ATCC 23134 TaxID=313606 RepID=A1ZXL4_MICM2|nr:hypothetical protein [Microscilla marina]EAY24889.1 hypothetical protein M23134_05864 [Microscilla marina ATCC 23134]